MSPTVIGRFAPSPTGDLHVGSALAALAAWCSVRSCGGRFVYRIEDLDPPRAVEGSPERQMEDMRWMGLDWDEGPGFPEGERGPNAPYRQSARGAVYEEALARLERGGHLFPCRVSRKDLQEVASAPHGHDGLPPYPPHLRPDDLAGDWYARYCDRDPDAALRFRVPEATITFDDAVVGPVEEDVRATTGDFVLKRRDGLYAYQLAVVVDDLAMGVTEVVRGQDLLDSTARQILLIRALGGNVPAYTHVPLLESASGEKLSKRDGALRVRALREAGVTPEALVGWLGHVLGQTDVLQPLTARALADRFDVHRIPAEAAPVPDDLADRLG